MPAGNNLFSLEGRVAIVTGASRGLGKEAAEGLAEAGAKVVLAARRAEWLEPTAREFEARGFDILAHRCDIAVAEQTQTLAAAALERYGRIDILVNNAGISWAEPFEKMPVDAWRKILETNVIGTQQMTRAVLPAMRQQGYGKIVNIASVMGLIGLPRDILEASGYTASKGALIALTRELAVQYAAHGVRVNALAPGFFPTRLSAGVVEKSSDRIKALTPLGRLGEAGEMKGAIVFLAAPASDYITGQIIAVDGGMTASVKEPMRSRNEYIESLRDGREVYFKGQRVPDVTTHPEIRLAIDHAAIDYDIAHDPAWRTLAVAEDNGQPYSRYFQLPLSSADLLDRSRLIEAATTLGGTLVVLIKEIGTDALFALHLIAHQLDQRKGTRYLDRVRQFHAYARDHDLALSVAQTDVKGDRSKTPLEQEHPDYYLRIVGETPEGIVVRGAKVHTSVSVNSNEMIVLPTRAMKADEAAYAVAFALPLNTKGLKLITSAYGAHHDDSAFDAPLASRHRMMETLTVFDDVLVPHDRVFLNGEWEFAGELAKTFVEFHRFTAISYKLPLVDSLVGAALLMAEYNGLERVKHVQEKLAKLVGYAETLRALLRLSALDAESGALGIAIPKPLIVNMAKLHFATNYHQMLAYVQDITGGLIATGPSEADFDNPATGPYVRRYLGGRTGVPVEHRIKAINLVKELTATDFAGYQAVLAIHAEGSIEAEKLAMVREHDSARCIALAKRLARIS